MINPRTRMTERINRARVSLEIRRAIQPFIVTLIGIAIGLGGFYYILDHIGAGSGDKRTVRFAVDDTTGLVAGRAEVRFKGIHGGIVTDIEVEDERAVVTAKLLDEYGPIYKDARAILRPNTPLQDMYLDIVDRGTPRAGGAGKDDVIPASQTRTSVHVAEVLDTFQPDTRARMKQLLRDLGSGLDDKGAQLRAAFAELGPFIDVMGRLSKQLAVRSRRTKRLVHNFGRLTSVLSERDGQLRSLVEKGSTVVSATADRRAGLDGTLRELSPALSELDRSFATVRGILPDVDTAVDRLDPVITGLPKSLAAVRRVSNYARPAVRELDPALARILPLSRQLRPFSRDLSSAVEVMRPWTPDLASITKDVAGCPVAAYMFFQWTASLGKFADAMGPYPRGDFGFGLDSVAGVDDPNVFPSPSCARGRPLGAER